MESRERESAARVMAELSTNRPGTVLLFADFRLEIDERRLWRGASAIPLPPKVFDLLVVLASHQGQLLEKEFLLQTLWPGTFVEDANLSVNISALRRALGDGVGEMKLIETVPKRGYRFVPIVTTEVPTSEGELIANAETPTPAGGLSGRRHVMRWLIGGGIIAASAGAAGVWRQRPGPMRTLAILPFRSATEEDRPLGLGMADALISRMSLIPELEVRPTNAVAGFQNRQDDTRAAGRRLGVEAVLSGTVQHTGARVRAEVELTRVADGARLWTQTFEDRFSNIFAMQDSMAERLAYVLSRPMPLPPPRKMSRRGTENTEAYQFYLHGQYLISKRINEATLAAIDYFNEAIRLDPEYPLPYAALATSYLIRAGEGWQEPELREKAKTAALKAVSLDGQSTDEHVAAGQVLMRSDWDWAGAEREFRQALSLQQSSAAAHAALGTLHTAIGGHDEAIREAEIACRLDPGSASLRSDLSWTLLFARRYAAAQAEAERATNLDVWSYTAHRQLAKALLLQGKFDEAIREANKTLEINGGRRRRVVAEVAAAMARARRIPQAEALLKELLRSDWPEPMPEYELAVAFTSLGRPADALRALSAACDQRLTRVVWLASDPELAPLRKEPAFAGLVRRLGLRER